MSVDRKSLAASHHPTGESPVVARHKTGQSTPFAPPSAPRHRSTGTSPAAAWPRAFGSESHFGCQHLATSQCPTGSSPEVAVLVALEQDAFAMAIVCWAQTHGTVRSIRPFSQSSQAVARNRVGALDRRPTEIRPVRDHIRAPGDIRSLFRQGEPLWLVRYHLGTVRESRKKAKGKNGKTNGE